MSFSEFWTFLQNDPSSYPKKLMALSTSAIVFCGLLVGMCYFIFGENLRYQVTQDEIKREMEFVHMYEQQAAEFQRRFALSAKPVPNKDVEYVQNEILRQIKTYNLSVVSVNSLAATAAPVTPPAKAAANENPVQPAPVSTGREFEMTVQGAWENTMKYLQQIEKGTALIMIRSIRIEPQQNASASEIKTVVKYKIYTE